MNKIPVSIACLLILAVTGTYLLRAEIWQVPKHKFPDDMFISADNDSFDPGLLIGSRFPAINALYRGQQINSVAPLVGDKGMIFIANRSADW